MEFEQIGKRLEWLDEQQRLSKSQRCRSRQPAGFHRDKR